MRELELERIIADSISATPVGKKVEINFRGDPTPIEIEMVFKGGWTFFQKLAPGMTFEFIRGEADYLDKITIRILPYDGPK